MSKERGVVADEKEPEPAEGGGGGGAAAGAPPPEAVEADDGDADAVVDAPPPPPVRGGVRLPSAAPAPDGRRGSTLERLKRVATTVDRFATSRQQYTQIVNDLLAQHGGAPPPVPEEEGSDDDESGDEIDARS